MSTIKRDEIRPLFDRLVTFAAEHKASDIFINCDSPVGVKIDGKLNQLNDLHLDEEDVYALIETIAHPQSYQDFLTENELNFMVEVTNVTYLRINAYKQRGLPGLVMRLIPSTIPSLDDLSLPRPKLLKKVAMIKRGLVIVIGATGNGKSTTLASMIDYRNANAQNHIITVEDPIEFMYNSKQSVVIQREIGIDTKSYGSALKNSLRQAPDVILIGEIRDSETMQYAMHFAETGHLCLATLHATNSIQALDRIYNFFPRELRKQLQSELSENLHCLITQRLLPRSDGRGRVVAMEMMMNTPYISQLILEGNLGDIPEAMARGNPDDGVFTFERSIFDLYENGDINYEDALQFVESPNNFRIKLRAESKRPLPPELQISGSNFNVLSNEQIEHELILKDRAEREAAKRKATAGKGES